MSFDPSFYPDLLTFSAVGFTVFIGGSTALYSILKDSKLVRTSRFFRIFVPIIRLLIVPGILLAMSPVPILLSLELKDISYACNALHLICFSYILAVFFLPVAFILGIFFLSLESHILRKFKKKLKEKGVPDFILENV